MGRWVLIRSIGCQRMHSRNPIFNSSKPWTRWWWFSGLVDDDALRYQLDWIKANGFGGVEIAWVYPLEGCKAGPTWLSEEWSSKVVFAKQYAVGIGLGCDFTFGSRWPFGGSIVPESDAAQIYGGLSLQRLELSWEDPFVDEPPFVLNHLDKNALERYSRIMADAFADALKGSTSALFCDSWEVQTEGSWTNDFDQVFQQRFGYSILEYIDRLDDFPDIRYDYRKLIADYVLNRFYRPFTEICHKLGAISRVQCNGSPTDLLAAYSWPDIPESEAILFEPDFSNIPASAAALSGKEIVSAEAFTSMYGWTPHPGPSPFQGREQVADMKLLADALFANGVNHIVWHGMPYNPEGGSNRFYTTVHVGPEAGFAAEIPRFNQYMETVCRHLRMGRTYSYIAVFLPVEDAWMKGELPGELRQSPDAKYHWEMRYERFPAELRGCHPLWISDHHLIESRYENGLLHSGGTTFTSLYIDVDWLDAEALDHILKLAMDGLPVCIKHAPKQPGKVKSNSYNAILAKLMSLPNASDAFEHVRANPPLVSAEDIPDFRCRIIEGGYIFFFAHPKSRNLRYPMTYGQSFTSETQEVHIVINIPSGKINLRLDFHPYQSLLLYISDNGDVDFIDIVFKPKAPDVQ